MHGKSLLVRPYLDFANEEELLRNVAKFQKKTEAGRPNELTEEFIVKTYKLSKRKENAFVDKL